jgi:hypothetical protein
MRVREKVKEVRKKAEGHLKEKMKILCDDGKISPPQRHFPKSPQKGWHQPEEPIGQYLYRYPWFAVYMPIIEERDR